MNDSGCEFVQRIKHGTCAYCDRSPSFGFPFDRLRRFCAQHRDEGTINLTKRSCIECEKTASFGDINGKASQYCSTHKKEGMVHTSFRKHEYLIID